MDAVLVQGAVIAASAFITVTGIILAIGMNNKFLGKIAGGFLLFSILVGAISILCSLVWFAAPEDYTKNFALIFLIAQFLTWFVPAIIMFNKTFYK